MKPGNSVFRLNWPISFAGKLSNFRFTRSIPSLTMMSVRRQNRDVRSGPGDHDGSPFTSPDLSLKTSSSPPGGDPRRWCARMLNPQRMAAETLGYMPLSKKRVVRLDRQTKILVGLAFLAGIVVHWTIGFFHRLTSLAPLSSALDNFQSMCVFPLFPLKNVVV